MVTKRPHQRPGPSRANLSAGPSSVTAVLAGTAIFACACAVFWPTLSYSFVWDDMVYIVKNPWIGQLTWESVRAIFTQPYFRNYLPLHLLSYLFDHAFWGPEPRGYHFSSVLLHGVNSVLCFAAAWKLSRTFAVGVMAGLLFAVHPGHIESVAWISSRKDLLSTAFMLLSLLAYLEARRPRGLRLVPYAVSVACFLLGMLSKASVVVLPAFLLLLDWTAEPRAARPSRLRTLGSMIPYGIVGAILVAVNSKVQVTSQESYVSEPLRYVAIKGHALGNYLGLLLGGTGRPVYDLPDIHGPVAALLDLLWLVVLPAAAWILFRLRRRVEFLGAGWIFIALLPAVLFPAMTYMADRYLYAPSIGFCWMVAAAIVGWGELDRFPKLGPKGIAALAAAAAIAAGFTLQTLRHSGIWNDSASLWSYAVTKSEDYRVLNNLADVRIGQKRYDEAERMLKISARTENVVAYQSLGSLYCTERRLDEALAATDRALEILSRQGRPSDPAADPSADLHYNRGAILWLQGNVPGAALEWQTALRENPAHALANQWLAVAERSLRR